MEQNQMLEKLKNNFKDNKPAWIVGGLVVIGIIAAIFISSNKNNEVISVEDGCQPGERQRKTDKDRRRMPDAGRRT